MVAFSEDQLNTQAGPGDGIVQKSNGRRESLVSSFPKAKLFSLKQP